MTTELELRFFATFRQAVGQKTVHREVDDGTTVGDLLAALESEYDGLDGELIVDGELREHLSVLLNGRDVVHQEGLDTSLSDGDTVSVFPPVAGGNGDPGRERTAGDDGDPERTAPEGLPDDVYPPGTRGETVFWYGVD
ncbi:hypothetical protein BRC81_04875 [Halobacteriales archaeon QS_1_68_20]|nr:MAG: hypothetical protein BRC81_04875 [Halobacteriales archaeon QS_1_68_20]